MQAPRSWAEQAYPNLIHYNQLDKGGHFAAWDQPELFVSERSAHGVASRCATTAARTARRDEARPIRLAITELSVACGKEILMSTAAVETAAPRSAPSTSRFRRSSSTTCARRIAATRWPSQELVADRLAGRAAGDDAGARPLLDDRARLAQGRGDAERAPAVHDRDRRGGHPLHPRQVAARERAAADHDARLARLGHRAARDRRPADRPDRARRQPPRTHSTWCCRPCPATASPASRPSSAGTPAASHARGRS